MSSTTIDDVASLAGVSIKTVSRVVNKEPNVRPSTREKVQAAVDELNYQPNQSARSLAGSRSYLVGLLYSNPSASYVIEVQSGALSACQQGGFGLLIRPCDYQDDLLANKVLSQVRQTRLDGLILTPPLSDQVTLTSLLKKECIPYVVIAPVDHDRDVISVFCDDRQAAFEMTEHLIQLGHRRIGFIIGHPDHGASRLRLSGYSDALKKHRIKFSAPLVKQGYFDFESGQTCARKLLELKQPPTAIFASNDDMAAGVMITAHQKGLKVPEQLSVVGFDDSPIARHSWPALSTIRQPVEEMAKEATALLINQIQGKHFNHEEVSRHCTLVLRDSIAAVD